MDEVFIDASFWIAIAFSRDSNHESAERLWRTVIEVRDWQTTTTNWTLYEAATRLNGGNLARHDLALALLELAERTTYIDNASKFENQALSIFRSHADKRWSIVDCANFVCIRERKSTFALSFDRDFIQAQNEFGFTLLPAGANT